MQKIITGALAALTLGGAVAATATPAAAQRYYGGYRHGGVSTGTAVGAGLLGLAVGAAVAGDRGYYGPRYGYGYYAPPPPAYYYGPSYYYPNYGYWHGGRYWHHYGHGRYW